MRIFDEEWLTVVNTSFVPLFLHEQYFRNGLGYASLSVFNARLRRIGRSVDFRYVALFQDDPHFGSGMLFHDWFNEEDPFQFSPLDSSGRLADGGRLSTALEELLKKCREGYPLHLVIEFSPTAVYHSELEKVSECTLDKKIDVEPLSLGYNCRDAWKDLYKKGKDVIRKFK